MEGDYYQEESDEESERPVEPSAGETPQINPPVALASELPPLPKAKTYNPEEIKEVI